MSWTSYAENAASSDPAFEQTRCAGPALALLSVVTVDLHSPRDRELPIARRTQIGLALIQGILGTSGLLGAWGLLTDPSGANFNWSTALLAQSPFTDFVVPGLALLLPIGLGSLVGALLSWRRHRYAGLTAISLGLFLSLFMVLEVFWIGLVAWLQPLFFALACAELLLGVIAHLTWSVRTSDPQPPKSAGQIDGPMRFTVTRYSGVDGIFQLGQVSADCESPRPHVLRRGQGSERKRNHP